MAPDVAVFYDGFNEIESQFADPSDRPTYIVAPQVRQKIRRPSFVGDVWRAYKRNSAAIMLARYIRSSRPKRAPSEALLDQHAINSVSIYRRGVEMALVLSKAYDFEARLFWQPTIYNKGGEDAALAAKDNFHRAVARAIYAHLKPALLDAAQK